MNDTLSVTPQVVSSSGFSDYAIDCIVEWVQINDECSHIDTLLKWQRKEIVSRHLPVIWGSGWACDVPLYLQTISDEDMPDVIDRLKRMDDNEWQKCYRAAENLRKL